MSQLTEGGESQSCRSAEICQLAGAQRGEIIPDPTVSQGGSEYKCLWMWLHET